MQPIDIVYTWVDDSFPGYLDQLNRYVADKRDTNPNRTRDNLDIIRYSMRSVLRNVPGLRHIHLLTCRPQVPDWLDVDHPQIKLVHHDQVMAPDILPTFNSFCIVSHLHLIPDVTDRFIYFEDDMLAMAPEMLPAMLAPDGRPLVHLKSARVLPLDKLNPKTSSPWNLALATADAALSRDHGPGPRRHAIHGPALLDKAMFQRVCQDYPELIAATRASRFRAGGNVPPEWLTPMLAVETGAAAVSDPAQAARMQGYVSLENFAPWTWWQLQRVERRRPLSITLNDSFEATPNPRVEAMVRQRLQRWFPEPAPWERPA